MLKQTNNNYTWRFLCQNFFHANQHVKIKKIISSFSQRQLATWPVKILSRNQCRNCGFWFWFESMRHIKIWKCFLSASLHVESKLTTSPFTEFAIFHIFPREQFNVQMTHLACDWQLELITAPIRNWLFLGKWRFTKQHESQADVIFTPPPIFLFLTIDCPLGNFFLFPAFCCH